MARPQANGDDTADPGMKFSPDPRFPSLPEFYRRVVEYAPTPIVAVRPDGQVLYYNQALRELGGWSVEDLDSNFAEHLHPAEVESMVEAFFTLVDDPVARVLGGGRRWSALYTRLIAKDGSVLPVEIAGVGGITDSVLNGIIYEVRPVGSIDLTGRILEGLSQGAPMLQLLSLVTEFVSSAPLDLDAAILQTDRDEYIVVASSSTHLTDALRHMTPATPWPRTALEPSSIDIDSLPDVMTPHLARGGYINMWSVDVHSPLTPSSLRLVAASPTEHNPPGGPLNRITRARQLSSAVLLRSQAEVLLSHAAGPDPLTNLPNRPAFYQRAGSLSATEEQAALVVHLDEMQNIVADTSQHTVDIAFQIVADRLRAATTSNHIIGRIDVDDFAILFERTPATDGAPQLIDEQLDSLATTLLGALSEPIFVGGIPVRMHASIGTAIAGSGVSIDQLLTWADAAMHDARRAGGGCTRHYRVGFG